MDEIKENQQEGAIKRIRAEQCAQYVQILLEFSAQMLLPFLDVIEEAEKDAGERESFSMSAAPILGAIGLDYDEKRRQWELRRKRAAAIANLLRVLKETEEDRQKYEARKQPDETIERLKKYIG